MGVKRLKIKDDLNYRRGYTWKSCSYCDSYVGSFVIARDENGLIAEPRCKIIGLNPGRLYRINPGNLCDKYEYTSPFLCEFEAGGIVPNGKISPTVPMPGERLMNKEGYKLYGPEWEKEMMKLDKKTLIAMLKVKLQEA